jgi:hypothetical protein
VLQRYAQDKIILDSGQQLHDALSEMGWEIMALRHQRTASSMGCFLILLLGGMMTCYMQGRTPLVIYFWSFALAAIAVIITRSSENMIKTQELPVVLSAAIIWSGNVLTMVVLMILGSKLSKPR